jgi:hypothetical protein
MAAATISVAELVSSGITLTAEEAVTIARATLEYRREDVLLSPQREPLRPENVHLGPGGEIICPDGSVPDVADVARLLRWLLPAGTPNVPGALRYTIARALLEVDAPPFPSPEAFSEALSRFQHDQDSQVLERVAERTASGELTALRGSTERRRPRSTTVSNLRHALRDADARLFEQERSREVSAAARPHRARNPIIIAAAITGALALLAAGGPIHEWSTTPAGRATAVGTSTESVADQTPTPRDIVLEPAARHAKVKAVRSARATGPQATRKRVSNTPADKRGFFAKFRLQWLRRAFS